jgi:hypothetical protein
MRTFYLLILTFVLSVSSAYSFDVRSEVYNPPLPYNGNVDWGTDYSVSATEPFGKVTGVYRNSNNSIYMVIPDTSIMAGKSIVVMMSSNNGANWSIAGSTTTGTVVSKTKLVGRVGNDSLYCFFISGSVVYTWNVITNFLNQFTNYIDVNYFDAAMSSTNNLYLIIDRNINNEVRIFSTLNSGASWLQTVNLSATAANPNLNMSATGDTALISYYGVAITPDTISSAIRTVRYRESVPGTLVVVGSFATPIAGGTPKPQFKAAMCGGKAWLFYSSGTAGSMDMNCIQSNDNGLTFGAPFTIGAMPERDEFWFDCSPYTIGVGGVDLVYRSDSTAASPSTNASTRLYYTLANNNNPSTFNTPFQISQHVPLTSSRGYTPSIIEFNNAGGDLGVAWVGLNGTAPNVYFDRYSAVTHVGNNSTVIADKFTLEQNYPNPFNPITQISFSLPKDANVTLKVFDASGKEVARLLNNEFRQANSYSVQFSGLNLSSGVYFYSLQADGFTDTKKMMLIK